MNAAAKPCGNLPDAPADSWRYGACNLPADHSGDHVNDACHTWARTPARGMSEGIAGLRLLPWTELNGKPAYTPDDNPSGLIARLADETEHAQIERAADVLSKITELLDLSKTTRLINEPSRVLLTAASTSLVDVLRVAVSRGMRLDGMRTDDSTEDEPAEPTGG
ncbi:hypothetical protein [Actinacidiphila glaucinigra]|uniref:Uncharacterized protein n=1 Tax=Actinacidiphila glaucinigra TaxID=235986 RepID=A0A239LC72_9ACTN|nr:hypothetical protein [Actinacidiphila glaucinigra]SNT27562.1 hypothetical protein SAMN05216252_11916 [Actinacidiphila glaucinigra]